MFRGEKLKRLDFRVVAPCAVAVACLILVFAPRFKGFTDSNSDLIPPEIIGVWTSEGAVLSKEGGLFEGQALYLRPDGKGSMIGGPPPIGINIAGTFDPATNRLTLRFSLDKSQPCRETSIAYDAQTKSLNAPSLRLKRHLDQVPAWLAPDFDRDPTPCAQ